ncbi:HAD family hydrolase [Hyphomicrobium sp.]|uniref:HAD family hydrolase n=1 Tax=Hyphomicrobium sp. TaxID=82 RepID=UPI000FB054AF|nr:HAD family hydrolase [Hyphomicrobium sp.]RUO97401.1 MAG: haloacid dehalogenase-like hydrolase [Hyphomicrobium sp.]
MKRLLIESLLFLLALTSAACAADPLPSWNDTAPKAAIKAFVERVTQEGSADFVPPAERIAVFDNDGTLWPENPVPFQMAYVFDELKRRSPNEPKLAADPMVQAALAGDIGKLLAGEHHDGLLRIVALTHAGITTDDFRARVEAWLASAKHPRFGRPYDQLTYQPMQELLRYLRANGFKTFIVSGGGADFMRVWSERVYGIPPDQVVGSTGRTVFELRDSGPVLVKTLDYLFVDDKTGKPVGIWEFIGRRPIACFGNSDGDQAMLEYTTINNPRPSFGLIVHHTDSEREYAYDVNPKSSGKLVEALKEAPQRGWTIVDMKNDWNTVFASDDSSVTAIDILLEPDATMLQHAEANNTRLLQIYPQGFALDAAHRPHITMLQCFVRTADLDKLYAAVEKVLSTSNVNTMKLEAFKFYYAPTGATGVAGIRAKPTPVILKLQAEIIDAAKPFMLQTGPIGAFTASHADSAIDAAIIDYVSTFVPKLSGENFNPHVSTGVAPRTYLDKMIAEPFQPFTFSPAGAAVYQLGAFGTAAKKLKQWN